LAAGQWAMSKSPLTNYHYTMTTGYGQYFNTQSIWNTNLSFIFTFQHFYNFLAITNNYCKLALTIAFFGQWSMITAHLPMSTPTPKWPMATAQMSNGQN
jgi:hypothetical protein